MVKLEGQMVPLRDLAQVSIKDAKTLMVNVNDNEVLLRVPLLLLTYGSLETTADTLAPMYLAYSPNRKSDSRGWTEPEPYCRQ